MNDYGSRHPQQFASAVPPRRPSGPPPRPPVPGLVQGGPVQGRPVQGRPVQGRPVPGPQQYPGRPGPVPAQRVPVLPPTVQQRPVQPPTVQQRPAQPQPRPIPVPVEDPDFVPTRKRSKVGKVVGVLVVVAALGGVGWVLVTGQKAPVTAAVGACVTQTGSDDISVVGCGDPKAQFKVDGKLDGKTVIDASLFACTDFPDATSAYWEGVEGQPGTVLCLAPVKAAAPAKP